METAWIQVFILTLSECVAPVGKTVCQQQQFELEFLTRRDCEYALQQLVAMKDELDNVIVDHGKSGCSASARETATYADVAAIRNAGAEDWREPGNLEEQRAAAADGDDDEQHETRLAGLKTCEETGGTAPCRIGGIIVEEATGASVEVWRRDR